MSEQIKYIIKLADQFGEHLNITHWAVSMRVAGKGAFIERLAQGGDARHLIAGIAMENIAPGARGRVQKSGQIAKEQILFNAPPTITFGDVFGVSSVSGQEGKIVENAGVTLLQAEAPDIFSIV